MGLAWVECKVGALQDLRICLMFVASSELRQGSIYAISKAKLELQNTFMFGSYNAQLLSGKIKVNLFFFIQHARQEQENTQQQEVIGRVKIIRPHMVHQDTSCKNGDNPQQHHCHSNGAADPCKKFELVFHYCDSLNVNIVNIFNV